MAATTAMESAAPPRGRVGPRTDEDLVEAVRRGDDQAFERLYERYNRRVAYYVYGMVHDYGRAEDIAQDVFISALRRMRQTERPIVFKPWIYEIAKNACIDQFRRSQRSNEVSYDAESSQGTAADLSRLAQRASTPDVVVEQKLSLDDLCGAFSGLSETHHQILVMRELEGLSYSEIGARLGMSRPAVESTLFRARRRLTEEYDELVTGERCRRVQSIIAGALEGALGTRDHRRLSAHVSHCQGCRRYAHAAGVDLGVPRRTVRSKVAAWLPFPFLLRRRDAQSGEAAHTAGGHASVLSQLSAQVTAVADPATLGWARAAAAAATVAVAGVGVGGQDHHLAAALMGHGAHRSPAAVAAPHTATRAHAHVVPNVRVADPHGLGPNSRSPAVRHEVSPAPTPAPRSGGPGSSTPALPAAVKQLGVPKLPTPASGAATQPLEAVPDMHVDGAVRSTSEAVRTQAAAAAEQGERAVDRVIGVLKGK